MSQPLLAATTTRPRAPQATRAATGIVVTLEAPGAVGAGSDAEVVERVLVPLLENAERFARTAVTISVGRDQANVIIDVRDDGDGIPADQLDRIFEPGVTFDGGGTGHDGAGLGLPLARRLARTAGGDVLVVPGAEGAHVLVSLPGAGVRKPHAGRGGGAGRHHGVTRCSPDSDTSTTSSG